MTQLKKKLLYFDIDKTILAGSTRAVKKNLQNGQLELKIKENNFDKIFCVGNVNKIFNGLEEMGQHVESVEIIYTLCFDAFTDFEWFLSNVCCTKESEHRIKQIQFTQDWWYMDSLADKYFKKVGKNEILNRQEGKRILIPTPEGDGQDILNWFDTIC
jgi:hypothetical protein